MIDNLPTATDFYQSGKELLNFAWETTANLLIMLDEADFEYDEEIPDRYWAKARRQLTTSLAIAQQGVELILKGKITDISPYLLILDPPTKWPSGRAIDFSEFRTVDAQDLIKVCDTFSDVPLTKEFAEKFQSLRKRRNTIMHSVDRLSIHVIDVVESILVVHKALFPTESWPNIRLKFIEDAPESELGADYATNRACWEVSIVKKLLKPAQVLSLLGVAKNQRSYFCPKCLERANTDDSFDFMLAVLRPKIPGATRLYCPVCNNEHEVIRQSCKSNGCRGDVKCAESEICLTCQSP